MKLLYMKPLAAVAIVGLAISVSACERKKSVDDKPKVVKTEKVVKNTQAGSSVTLESLNLRVSDIERRMAVARKQYMKDREELRARFP
jgi:hypothetical protein